MKSNKTPLTFRLEPEDNNRLLSLCGEYNENLKQVEKRFKVSVSHRGHLFYVDGEKDNVSAQSGYREMGMSETHYRLYEAPL